MVLPNFPRAFCNNNHVVVEYEDGSHEVWAEYPSIDEAREIAESLSHSLKVLAYARNVLRRDVAQCRTDLLLMDVSVDLVEEAISEALYSFRLLGKDNDGKLEDYQGRSNDSLFDLAVVLTELERHYSSQRTGVESLLRNRFSS